MVLNIWAAGGADDAAAAFGVASTDASCPSPTSPDRANGVRTMFGGVAVWANCAWYCAAASGAKDAGPWLVGAKLT